VLCCCRRQARFNYYYYYYYYYYITVVIVVVIIIIIIHIHIHKAAGFNSRQVCASVAITNHNSIINKNSSYCCAAVPKRVSKAASLKARHVCVLF
jgi:hypothetical protein